MQSKNYIEFGISDNEIPNKETLFLTSNKRQLFQSKTPRNSSDLDKKEEILHSNTKENKKLTVDTKIIRKRSKSLNPSSMYINHPENTNPPRPLSHGKSINFDNGEKTPEERLFKKPSERLQQNIYDDLDNYSLENHKNIESILELNINDSDKTNNNAFLLPTPNAYQKLISTIRVKSPEPIEPYSIDTASNQREQIKTPIRKVSFQSHPLESPKLELPHVYSKESIQTSENQLNQENQTSSKSNLSHSNSKKFLNHLKQSTNLNIDNIPNHLNRDDSLASLILEFKPQSTPSYLEGLKSNIIVQLEPLINLISAIGLEPFQSIWEEDDELDCGVFIEEASKVIKSFSIENSTLIIEKFPEFAFILDSNLSKNDLLYVSNIYDNQENEKQEYIERLSPQLESLFNRIDANGNGMLDWDEFASFFLLGLEGDRKMKLSELEDRCYLLEEEKRITDGDKKNLHKDNIQRIIVDDENSIYYTLSEHGQLKRWIFMKSTQTYVFLSNMNHSSERILDVQLYDKYVITSDLSRRFLFFERVSGELVCTLVGRNGTRHKVRNTFENSNFISNVNRQLKSHLTKTQDSTMLVEKIHQLSDNDQPTDIIQYKKASQRKQYLGGYKEKILGKDHVQLQTQENHRVYILETLGQNGGIPMSFKISKYKDNEFAADSSSKDILIIGTDGGLLKTYEITQIINGNDSIITKNRNECSIFPIKTSDKSHNGWISCLEIDPKEKVIITGSWDCTIKVWSLQFLSVLRTLQGHKKPIHNLIYDPKMKLIASCGREKEIYLWKPHSPSAIDIFVGHDSPVLGISFNSPENQLVSLSSDQVIRVWDLFLYKCVQVIPVHQDYASMNLTSISVDQIRNCIVAGNFTNGSSKLTTWHMKKDLNNVSNTYQGHKSPIVKVLWNKRSKEVVTCDQNSVAVWNCVTGKMIFKFHSDEQIVGMCFDTLKRRIIISYSFSKVLKIFNFYNGQCLKTLSNEASQKEVSIILYINQKLQREKCIIGGTEEGNVLKWIDGDDTSEPIQEKFEKNSNSVTSIAYSSPDTLIVGYEDGGLWLLSLSQGFTRMKASYQSITNRANKKENKNLRIRNNFRKLPIERSRSPSKTPSQIRQDLKKIEKKRSVSANAMRRDSVLEKHKQDNLQVEVLHCLKSKKPIFVCSYGNGVISFSSSLNLNEIYRMRGTENSQDTITTIVTNKDDSIMVTGDSAGFITIYDISGINDPQNVKGLDIMITSNNIIKMLKFQAFEINGVTTLAFAESISCIIAGGGEKYVSLYTLSGRLVGVFGQSKQWDIDDATTWGLEAIPGVGEDTSHHIEQTPDKNEYSDIISISDLPNSQIIKNSTLSHWLKLDNSTPQTPVTISLEPDFGLAQKQKKFMDEFDDLDHCIQEKVLQKQKSLNKESDSIQLPSIHSKVSKKPDSKTLEIQHHREKSKIVFENQFRKGHAYEQRIHSYLEIERVFINPSVLGGWKNDTSLHFK